MRKVLVSLFLVFLLTLSISSRTHASELLAQSCNWWGRLLEQSNCNTNYENYKEGYKNCVHEAAKWFWKNYACSWESVEKLNKACEGCEKTYKK
ncbi:MAG: hypothetical protein Q8O04_07950 [Deltaproteobacteria bacterium]|nr:hypothetical protein [Deltaproteobacteria bacterium]